MLLSKKTDELMVLK